MATKELMISWERHITRHNNINTVFLQALVKCFVQLRKPSPYSAGYRRLIGKDSKRNGYLSFGLKDREDCVSRSGGKTVRTERPAGTEA